MRVNTMYINSSTSNVLLVEFTYLVFTNVPLVQFMYLVQSDTLKSNAAGICSSSYPIFDLSVDDG